MYGLPHAGIIAQKLLEEQLGEELSNSPIGETIRGGIKGLLGGRKKNK